MNTRKTPTTPSVSPSAAASDESRPADSNQLPRRPLSARVTTSLLAVFVSATLVGSVVGLFEGSGDTATLAAAPAASPTATPTALA